MLLSDGDSPFPDPVSNPIGFWVLFGLFSVFVVGLLIAAIWFVRRHGPKVWNRDPGQGAFDRDLDGVRDAQRRLDEQLAKLRADAERRRPEPPDDRR